MDTESQQDFDWEQVETGAKISVVPGFRSPANSQNQIFMTCLPNRIFTYTKGPIYLTSQKSLDRIWLCSTLFCCALE